jgi:hypothetical protein
LEIKLIFTKMPSEVFEQFIQPQLKFDIDSLSVLETFITAPNWAKYFRHKSLSFWVNVEWVKLSVRYKESLIDPKAVALARQLMNDFGESSIGETAIRANVQDSKARFEACASFMQSMRKFPKPLICLDTGDFWDLLDGYHRLAALQSIEEHDDFIFDVYLGKHHPNPSLGTSPTCQAKSS